MPTWLVLLLRAHSSSAQPTGGHLEPCPGRYRYLYTIFLHSKKHVWNRLFSYYSDTGWRRRWKAENRFTVHLSMDVPQRLQARTLRV
ncbi:unnamed protein product [Ixodes persulcatus]